jgi:alcohol dehydrogenase class IV
MKPFRFSVTTPIYFGADCIKDNAALFKSLGKRAFVITSRFAPDCRHYSLEDIEAVLQSQGIEYKVNMEVQENPPVSSVVEIAAEAIAFKPDFLVAPGGGSAIDTAKAVSVLLKYPGKDPMTVLYGSGLPYGKTVSEGGVPLVAVPTTAGTGADVSGFSVLTREDTQTKLTISQMVFPDVSFLDAKYIKDTPPLLTHTGALDALSHGVETYINVGSNFMNRSIAEIGFKLFAEYKDAMLVNTYTFEQRENMLLASTVMGMAFMQSGTCLPHGMSYPLSHYKHVPHGIACGVLLGEYLRILKNQSIVLPIVRMCGFASVDEFAGYIKKLVALDIDIDVTEKEIAQWSEEFFSLKFRLVRHPEPISLDDIKQIYRNSLSK